MCGNRWQVGSASRGFLAPPKGRRYCPRSHHPARKPAGENHDRCRHRRRRAHRHWRLQRGTVEPASPSPGQGCHLRSGTKMGNVELVDTMIKDGLWDAFNGYHMGNTAENVAQKWQITRPQQDAFAAASQQKAEAAQKAGRFKDEIVPVTISS